MKIKLLAIGKTDDKQIKLLFDIYEKRLKHYVKFEFEVLPDVKNAKKLSEKEQKEREGEQILKKILSTDQLILLDEKGHEFRLIEFSRFLQKK